MSYSSRYGKRPIEQGSLSSHSHIINDTEVQDFINNCAYPKEKESIQLDPALLVNVDYPASDPIQHIIAVDGAYTLVSVKKTFPSSLITFFQFGILLLHTKDLDAMANEPFISRVSMERLKDLERSKLVLPTKNVAYRESLSITDAVRTGIFGYFQMRNEGTCLLDTLYWFLFELYDQPVDTYQLASCPHCSELKVELKRTEMAGGFSQPCPVCSREILLTDVFRFHEVVDDEAGAGGILGYLTNLIEHFNLIHTIKSIVDLAPVLLNYFLLLKDGPLAFFGQTANMHKPMRKLCNYLSEKHNLYLAGLEKSGAFVEHAGEIKDLLQPGQALLLSNEHIYKYILPGRPESQDPFGKTSYYSGKVIFKSRDHRMHVITLPLENSEMLFNPQVDDLKNFHTILWNIEKLRCDMYDNAIVPVALANKLISLSNRPSTVILEKFAKQSSNK